MIAWLAFIIPGRLRGEYSYSRVQAARHATHMYQPKLGLEGGWWH